MLPAPTPPPLPELRGATPHLENYRRVYRASEAEADQAVGPAALADYLRTDEALDARPVVVKARDAESTFGFKVDNRAVAAFCQARGPRFIGFAGVDDFFFVAELTRPSATGPSLSAQ